MKVVSQASTACYHESGLSFAPCLFVFSSRIFDLVTLSCQSPESGYSSGNHLTTINIILLSVVCAESLHRSIGMATTSTALLPRDCNTQDCFALVLLLYHHSMLLNYAAPSSTINITIIVSCISPIQHGLQELKNAKREASRFASYVRKAVLACLPVLIRQSLVLFEGTRHKENSYKGRGHALQAEWSHCHMETYH